MKHLRGVLTLVEHILSKNKCPNYQNKNPNKKSLYSTEQKTKTRASGREQPKTKKRTTKNQEDDNLKIDTNTYSLT